MSEQTIRLGPRAIAFTAVCEACAEGALGAESWLAATVEGRLQIDQARGSVCCPRGHVLRVERVERARHSPLAVFPA
jgi:hypothetical protein